MNAFPARYWKMMPDGRIQCDLCPRQCRLKSGQRGLCFVRMNQSEQLVLTTYGRSSGYCIDPIEKKPLNHFLPGTPVLSFGTAGCNLSCKFCQNWDMSKARQMDVLMDQATPEKIATVAQQLSCRSVAYTYNDPVIFLEYAVDVAQACRARNIKSVAVTAGYICAQARKEFFSYMDAANVDLKAFTENFYKRLCSGQLSAILDTLVYIKHHTKVWLEITTLLIPGQNDDSQELHALSSWIYHNLGPDVPLHFTAFHPDYKLTQLPRTPIQTLSKAREIAKENGLHHVYTGNVHDKSGASTYCHQCGTCLIGRDWYTLSEWHLDTQGCCQTCASPLAGLFDEKPGDWGAKRQRVQMDTFST